MKAMLVAAYAINLLSPWPHLGPNFATMSSTPPIHKKCNNGVPVTLVNHHFPRPSIHGQQRDAGIRPPRHALRLGISQQVPG
uniref:Uncharacterized protein n=1 Tax=Arundo donax TaxID=35708 RepID=A0A0A9FSU4_ARUDO